MKYFSIIISILLLLSCASKESIVKNDDSIAKEIKLTNEQIKEYDQNFNSTPFSDIKYSELEEAKKSLNYEERKNYYFRLLGKKVKWSGEVERVSTSDYSIGKNHIEIEPPIAGGINVIHLFTNQDIKTLRSYIDDKVIFVGYIYKIGKGGEPYLKAVKIRGNED